jgi:predicted enzyme related to lactoylglutathione lyase
MISGAHMILYSTNAEADRAFFREVLEFPYVDAGHGWLIFALPPAEIAVHPDAANGRQEIYLMCDDVDATMTRLQARDVACDAVTDQGWGRLTHLTLPGGGKLGLYQPRHPLAPRTLE